MKKNVNTTSLGRVAKGVLPRIAIFAMLVAVAGVWGFSQDQECVGRDLTFKTFKGKVTSTDRGDNTVTISKGKANNRKIMTFDICEGGIERGDKRMDFSDIKKGANVRAYYSTDKGIHTARRLRLRS